MIICSLPIVFCPPTVYAIHISIWANKYCQISFSKTQCYLSLFEMFNFFPSFKRRINEEAPRLHRDTELLKNSIHVLNFYDESSTWHKKTETHIGWHRAGRRPKKRKKKEEYKPHVSSRVKYLTDDNKNRKCKAETASSKLISGSIGWFIISIEWASVTVLTA